MDLEVESSFDDSFLDDSADVSRVSLDLSFDLNLSQASLLDASPVRHDRRTKLPFEVSPPRHGKMLIDPANKTATSAAPPKKRGRFAESQTGVLEAHFADCVSPSQEVCERLTRQLNLTLEQVKVWFQNRRQREKRGKLSKTLKKARLAQQQAALERNRTEGMSDSAGLSSTLPDDESYLQPSISGQLKVISEKKLPKLTAKVAKWASKVCRIAWSVITIDPSSEAVAEPEQPSLIVPEAAMLIVSQLMQMERVFELAVVPYDKLGLSLAECQCVAETLFRGDEQLNLELSDIVRVANIRIQYMDQFLQDKTHPSHQILPLIHALGNVVLEEWPFDHGPIFRYAGNVICKKLQVTYQNVFQKCHNAISPDEHLKFRSAYADLARMCQKVAQDADTSFEIPSPADAQTREEGRALRRRQRHLHFTADPSLTTYRKLREQYAESEVPEMRAEIIALLKENAVGSQADKLVELMCRILVDDKQCAAAEQAISDQPSNAIVRYVYYNLAREFPLHVLNKAQTELLTNLPAALATLHRRLFPNAGDSVVTYLQDPDEYETRLLATFGTIHAVNAGPTTMVNLLADGEWRVYDRYLDYVDSHSRPDFVSPYYYRGLAGWMEVARVAAFVARHSESPATSKDQSLIASIREGGYADLPGYRDLVAALQESVRETFALLDEPYQGTPFKSFVLSKGGQIDLYGVGSEYGAMARLAQAALCSELLNFDLAFNPALNLAAARVFNLD